MQQILFYWHHLPPSMICHIEPHTIWQAELSHIWHTWSHNSKQDNYWLGPCLERSMTPLRCCLHLFAHLLSRWEASPTAAAPPAWLHLSVCPAPEQKKHFLSSCCCGSSLLGPSEPFCCFIFSLQCLVSRLLLGGRWVCEAPTSSTTSRAVAHFTATSMVWAAGEEPGKLCLHKT